MQLDKMIQNVIHQSWTDYCMKWDCDDEWDRVSIGGVSVAFREDCYMYDSNGMPLAYYEMVDTGSDDDYDMGAIVTTRYHVVVIQPDGKICNPEQCIRDN